MTQLRVSVALPDLDAASLVRIAPFVEENALEELWVGDPGGARDSSWVMTVAGALTAVTASTRLGIFVALGGSSPPLQIAEDIGVLDQASGGRVELGLVVPDDSIGQWETDVRSILTAWHGWTLPDGAEVPVTPPPAQPFLPRLLVRPPDFALATRLGAGIVVDSDRDAADGVLRRVVLLTEIPGGDAESWLSGDPVAPLVELRSRSAQAGADTLLFVIDGNDLEAIGRALTLLGAVVAPGVRCADFQVETVARSAWSWLYEKQDVHEAALEVSRS